MATKEATALSALQRAKMIAELRSAFKYRSGSVARLLEQNMGKLCELMQQGKLTARQLQCLKDFIRTHKVATSAASGYVTRTSTTNCGTKSAAATAATASKSGLSTDVFCSPKNVNGKRPRSPSSLRVPSAPQSVRIARVLEQNMGQLCKLMQQGKITAV
ncbi:hypothetical protein EDB19DRAFT_2048272 [Suillus lakei]|nr:hypothetical protein EDB19DRAFT_2048272 [Suillus lakei]